MHDHHHSLRLVAAPVLAVVVSTIISLGCSDQRIVEPDCEGCFRFHVDFPNSSMQTVLRDIYFIGATGWVVGQDGLILKSTDSGATWSTMTQISGRDLSGVHALHQDTVWTVSEDGRIFRSFTGGAPFSEQYYSGVAFTSVFILDKWRAWTVGNDIILKTNNGGTSWQVYDDVDNVLSTLYGVTFPGPNKGWVVGSGNYKILHTDDGGYHWTPQNNPSTQPLLDVAFPSASAGWAVGVGGTIVHTADGGLTWTKQSIGTDRVLHGVDFWDVNTGVVVGDAGVVFTTTDGGATWEERVSGTDYDLLKVSYIDANSFCVCGYNGTLLLITRRWDDCCE